MSAGPLLRQPRLHTMHATPITYLASLGIDERIVYPQGSGGPGPS